MARSLARSRTFRHGRSCFWKSLICQSPKNNKPLATSAGIIPMGFSIWAFAVSTQMISVAGRLQNSADNPRASLPSERSSSALGGVIGEMQNQAFGLFGKDFSELVLSGVGNTNKTIIVLNMMP